MNNKEGLKGFCMFFDWVADFDKVGPEIAWSLVRDISNYIQTGEEFVDKYKNPLENAFASRVYHEIMRNQEKTQNYSDARKNVIKRKSASTVKKRTTKKKNNDEECAVPSNVYDESENVTECGTEKNSESTMTDNIEDSSRIIENDEERSTLSYTKHNITKHNNTKHNETKHSVLTHTASARSADVPPAADERPRNERVKENFERFWSVYPKKIKKDTAFDAFCAIDPDDALLATIIAAVNTQKRSEWWTKDNKRYIPLAENWLRDRRWEDELPAPSLGGIIPPTVDYSVLFQ